jgi:hypothetical protein
MSRAEKILKLAEEFGAACQASDLGQTEIYEAWQITWTLLRSCAWFIARDDRYLEAVSAAPDASPPAASEAQAGQAVETDGPKFREFF